MKRLILLRHGQTEWNRVGRVQGQSDAPLNELGHTQAQAVAPVLAALRPSHLWCSDLSRAADTAAYVAESCGLAATADPRLREWGFGHREGLTHEEFRVAEPDVYEQFRLGRYDAVAGSEHTSDVRGRMVAALTDLLAQTPEGGTSIAVSHGAAIKLGVGGLLGWDDREAVDVLWGMSNCGWAELTFTVGEPARLAAYNRVAH